MSILDKPNQMHLATRHGNRWPEAQLSRCTVDTKDSARATAALHCGMSPVLIHCKGRGEDSSKRTREARALFNKRARGPRINDQAPARMAWLEKVSLCIPQHRSASLQREGDVSCEDYYRPNSSVDRKLLINAKYRTAIFSCMLLFPEASRRSCTLQRWLPNSWGWALLLVPRTNLSETLLLLQLPKCS